MPFVMKRTVGDAMKPEHAALLGGGKQMHRPMPTADIVMVFPFKTSASVRWSPQGDADDMEALEAARGLTQPSASEQQQMQTWHINRQGVITALSDSGLILLVHYSRDRDEIFVRIAADDDHLRQVAEMKRHKLELKPEYLSAFAEYKNDFAGRREVGYVDRRVVSHLYKAHVDSASDYPAPDAIFRSPDRIQLIDFIIRSSGHHCASVDVGQLMHDENVRFYFPLHDHKKLIDLDMDFFHCFISGRNIDKVRDYFGEHIAMYFLFMSHFNKWLILPALVGTICWLLDLFVPSADPDGLHFRRSPDNVTAPIVALGMGIWGMLFIHYWRRTAAEHACKWGTLGQGQQFEPTRPEFRGVSRINPVTGRVDRYYPWSERIFKVLFSYSVIFLSLGVLCFCVMMLMALRHYFSAVPTGPGRLTFQFINALVVPAINAVFTAVAKKLTKWENHRTDSEYANHLLAKTVVFKFVNCYISLYYIAFFKDRNFMLDVFPPSIPCVNHDCLSDLGSQLAMFVIVRLTLMNILELGLPRLVIWWRSFTEGRLYNTSMFKNAHAVMPTLTSAEKQSKMEEYDVYEDMDEVLIMYGYATLFVVACPWVPVLTLVGNVLEAFLDSKKLMHLFRRPFPVPAANNEPWDTAFDMLGILAMMTNAAVVVFASHFFDGWSHHGKIVLFLAVEHLVVIGRLLVSVVQPSMPHWVSLLQLQQKHLVHKHMDLGGEEDDHETRASALIMSAMPPPVVYDRDDEDDDV